MAAGLIKSGFDMSRSVGELKSISISPAGLWLGTEPKSKKSSVVFRPK